MKALLRGDSKRDICPNCGKKTLGIFYCYLCKYSKLKNGEMKCSCCQKNPCICNTGKCPQCYGKQDSLTSKMIKVLNLYAGIGGNRKLWTDVDVTAVEINPEIARIYQDFFPEDKVIVGDAHQYLLEHYKEFDFIWSSPPCQSHSSFRKNICVRYRGTKAKYPDMKLYEEIIFLRYHFMGLWVVENVKPYYEALIKQSAFIQRHNFWSNFDITDEHIEQDKIRTAQIPQLQQLHDFDLSSYKLSNKRQVLRNCVHPKLGLHVFSCAFKEVQKCLT